MNIFIKALFLVLFSTFVFAGEEKVTLPNSTEQQTIQAWAPHPLELQKALEVTNKFINELNTGNSLPGWDLLSEDLKEVITKEEWESVFVVLRNSLGKREKTKGVKS